jgi:hypothetical protein
MITIGEYEKLCRDRRIILAPGNFEMYRSEGMSHCRHDMKGHSTNLQDIIIYKHKSSFMILFAEAHQSLIQFNKWSFYKLALLQKLLHP